MEQLVDVMLHEDIIRITENIRTVKEELIKSKENMNTLKEELVTRMRELISEYVYTKCQNMYTQDIKMIKVYKYLENNLEKIIHRHKYRR